MDEIEIKAKLKWIIFENATTHYVVARFTESKNAHPFVATGYLIEAQENQSYLLTGNYVEHPKYGKQFKINQAKKELPKNNEAIIRFLSSDTFPTIGKKTAETIYEVLGEDCLIKIKKDSQCLKGVPGLNQKKIDILSEGIQSFDHFSESFSKLISFGVEPRKISLLTTSYKDIDSVLQEDCFRPYYEIKGFGYKTACKIADGYHMQTDDLRRKDAFIHYTVCDLSMTSGNTYITTDALLNQIYIDPIDLFESLERLEKIQALTIIDKKRIYPYHLYEEEVQIAQLIHLHHFKLEPIDKESLEQYIREVEFDNSITYDDIQKEAIKTFFSESIMIINGGPGTGKTTIVKGILEILRQMDPNAKIQLCAPTGLASKRLALLSHNNSKTIHSLLKWDMTTDRFGANVNNPIEADYIIIDEFSMVDTHLFASLLDALPSHCRILLIGDENQLESVGPGKVFEDLIQSNQFPIVHLEKIYRQSEGSGIVELASQIRNNEACTYQDGVTFIEKNTNEIIPTLVDLAKPLSLNHLQILAPMYNVNVGIDAINNIMQNLFNPKAHDKEEYVIGTTLFREQDKVMLLKNLPDEDVYNGDIGRIVHIEKNKKDVLIQVQFHGKIVDFTENFWDLLKLAYCISIHKSQGSEYPIVIVVVDQNTKRMLNQRLLYTAISRAKKQLILIGQKDLFEQCVQLKESHDRQTSLCELIKSPF